MWKVYLGEGKEVRVKREEKEISRDTERQIAVSSEKQQREGIWVELAY